MSARIHEYLYQDLIDNEDVLRDGLSPNAIIRLTPEEVLHACAALTAILSAPTLRDEPRRTLGELQRKFRAAFVVLGIDATDIRNVDLAKPPYGALHEQVAASALAEPTTSDDDDF